MEVEVLFPSPPPVVPDFNFDSACTSPYISAPSSPQRFGTFFYSAPTSPTRATSLYNGFNSFYYHEPPTTTAGGGSGGVPFIWEEKPGISKTKETCTHEDDDDDDDDDNDHKARETEFSFDFSGQLDRFSLSAEELFDGGKIKPLKPPPRLQYAPDSPKSPRSPKRMIKQAFSPRHRRKDFDPFAAAIEQARKENVPRGRERTITSPSIAGSRSRHKQTRSLSPFRVSDLLFDCDTNQETVKNSSVVSSKPSIFSSSTSLWYKKWKIKDLLLFRSASESRATDKDQLKKYAMLKKTHQDDVKNSSFRSTDSTGSLSSRRRGPPISAHEMHYTVKRAVSEEMKKRTFLPYRQGLLGCLGFNPSIHSSGSMSRR